MADRTSELMALNAVAAAVSQSLNLEVVLNTALNKTVEVMSLDAGGIYLLDEESGGLSIAAHRGFGSEFLAEMDRLKDGEDAPGTLAQSDEPQLIRDVSADPRLATVQIEKEGLRSLATVPLISKGRRLGALLAATRGSNEIADPDVRLLASIARQIGMAIENARLFETQLRRADQYRVIGEVGRRITSVFAVDELLETIVKAVTQTFGHQLVGIGLIEDEELVFRTVAGTRIDDPWFQPTRVKLGGKGITAWVAATGEPLLVPDVTVEPRYLFLPGSSDIRSELAVPLKTKTGVIGVLDVQSEQRNAFDDSDLAMLQSLASYASVAIEEARLIDAEQRRAEQFRVISEVGQRISSILPVDELLREMARVIRDALDYHHVAFGLVEGDEVVYRAGAGVLWDDPDFKFEPARLKIGLEGLTGWVVGAGEPLLVPDVGKEPRYIEMRGSKTRSELTVPIKARGKVLGVLDAQSDRLGAFDESDLAVLQSLADQAGVAIENATLFEAERRRAEEFRVVSEVGRRIATFLDLDELLEQMATLIQAAFDYYLVEIGLIEEDDLVFKVRAAGDRGSDFESFRLRVGEEGVTGWVAGAGEPLLVPDVSQEPRYVRVTATKTRSELALPITAKEKVIGVLNVESDRLDAFDESDLAVLQSLAQQAGLAIEKARLLAAEQKRADELDALYTTLTDITAELELPSLLEAIVKRAAGLMNATGGELGLYDEASQEIRIVVSHNLGGDYVGTIHRLGEGAMGKVATTGQPLVIEDYQRWEGALPEYPEIHAVLATPLEVGGRLLGVFTTVSTDPDRSFDSSDLHLLSIFARQAAIAIENARLYEDTARRLAGLTALQETTRAVASTLELGELLNLITRQAATLLQAGGGMINLVDWESNEDEVVAGTGLGSSAVGSRGSLEGSLSGWVTLHNQPVISNQAQSDPRVDQQALATLVDDSNKPIRSFAIAPLTTKEKVMGTLVVMHKQATRAEFDQADLDLLVAFANQAATAMENASLYEQAQQLAVLEERQRLARDLHDSVSQTLFSASLVAEVVPMLWNKDVAEGQRRLEELRQLTRGAMAEMRTLLMELRPATLTEVGLDDLLQQLAEVVTARARLPVELHVEWQRSLPADVQIALYRIAQEALNNVVRHAEATQVDITLLQSDGRVELRVTDDGQGFEPDDVAPERLGLGIMRERAQKVGASLEIDTEVGRGTQVSSVWIDAEKEPSDE